MTTKVCSSCGIEKSRHEFGRNSAKRDGLCAACKVCRNARRKRYYIANREQEIKSVRAWNLANPEQVNLNKRASYLRHKDRITAESREAYVSRRDEVLAVNTAWRKANPAKCAEIKARRRARKKKACPKWLSRAHHAQIKEFFQIARVLSFVCGEEFHVDHIVPLTHPKVCGLHVPWNLQVLTARENAQKGNRFEVG